MTALVTDIRHFVGLAVAAAAGCTSPGSLGSCHYEPFVSLSDLPAFAIDVGAGFLAAPTLVPTPDGMVVVGSAIDHLRQPVVLGDSAVERLVVRELDGTDWGIPEGDFLFGYPRGVEDGSGRFHLIWGEPRPGADLSSDWWYSDWVSQIWHAVRSNSGEWSKPVLLFDSEERLIWRPRYSAVSLDASGAVHVAVPFLPTKPGILHLTTSNPAAAGRLTDLPSVYADVASDGDVIHAVFNAFSPGGRRDQTIAPAGVYHARNTAGSWEPARLVSALGEHEPGEVEIAVVGSDLHVLWALGPDSVAHAISLDKGKSWSGAPGFQVSGPFNDLNAVGDQCGGLVAVLKPFPDGLGKSRLMYGRFTDAGWVNETFPTSIGYPSTAGVTHSPGLGVVVYGPMRQPTEIRPRLSVLQSRVTTSLPQQERDNRD